MCHLLCEVVTRYPSELTNAINTGECGTIFYSLRGVFPPAGMKDQSLLDVVLLEQVPMSMTDRGMIEHRR